MTVSEAGKACYDSDTQGSGPRANEMGHGVIWLLEAIAIG